MSIKYFLVRAVRRQIPERTFFRLMNLGIRGLRANGAERVPDRAFAHCVECLQRMGVSLAGLHVMEVGSGRYARMGLRMLAHGARAVTLLDLYATQLEEPAHRALLVRDCGDLKVDPDKALASIRVVPGDITMAQIPPDCEKADVVLSMAVLEHVRDPAQVLARCRLLLKPGGRTCHMVDLRDHYFRYPFHMLTYTDEVWQRWLNPRGGFFLNRWRVQDYVDAMHKAGFSNVTCEVTARDEAGLQAVLPRLDLRYRRMNEADLSALKIILYGENACQKQCLM